MIDPLTDDPLRDEFDRLEREVRQRDCPHERRVEVTLLGGPREWLCLDCNIRLATDGADA